MKDEYRTNDGRAFFEFDFVNAGPYFDVYITKSPSYGNRSSDLHSTHRIQVGNSYKICFADPSVANNLDKARKYSETWAEMTWKYIQTGKKFEDQNQKEMGWGTRLAISAALAALGIPFIG